MNKVFLSLVAVFSALTLMAQTPVISTSDITFKYCDTKLTTTTVNMEQGDLPYIWDGDTITQASFYERLYTAIDGCDSVARLVLTTYKAFKFLIAEKGAEASVLQGNPLFWQYIDTVESTYNIGVKEYQRIDYYAKQDVYIQLAPGNLQYQASTGTFRFAEHGYTYLSQAENAAISSTNTGWIDMFGYGTSGYTLQPYESSTDSTIYRNTQGNWNNEWGTYNPIGTDPAGTWNTFTGNIFTALFSFAQSENRLGGGSVTIGAETYKGWIVLPNDFVMPQGMPNWVAETKTDNKYTAWANSNAYTEAQWQQMEEAGAAFFLCENIQPRYGTAFSETLYSKYDKAKAAAGTYYYSWGGGCARFNTNDVSLPYTMAPATYYTETTGSGFFQKTKEYYSYAPQFGMFVRMFRCLPKPSIIVVNH